MELHILTFIEQCSGLQGRRRCLAAGVLDIWHGTDHEGAARKSAASRQGRNGRVFNKARNIGISGICEALDSLVGCPVVRYFILKSFKNGGLILDPHLSIFGVPKNAKKSIRALFLGVSEGVLKMEPRPGLQKVRFCGYLLHLS